MTPDVNIRTDDLARTLDYLDGLLTILQRLSNDRVGKDAGDPLIGQLEEGTAYSDAWDALRYQVGVGAGWSHVGENIADLRDRLLAAYGDAAL